MELFDRYIQGEIYVKMNILITMTTYGMVITHLNYTSKAWIMESILRNRGDFG